MKEDRFYVFALVILITIALLLSFLVRNLDEFKDQPKPSYNWTENVIDASNKGMFEDFYLAIEDLENFCLINDKTGQFIIVVNGTEVYRKYG